MDGFPNLIAGYFGGWVFLYISDSIHTAYIGFRILNQCELVSGSVDVISFSAKQPHFPSTNPVVGPFLCSWFWARRCSKNSKFIKAARLWFCPRLWNWRSHRSVGLRNVAQAAVPKNVARPKASEDNFCSSAGLEAAVQKFPWPVWLQEACEASERGWNRQTLPRSSCSNLWSLLLQWHHTARLC